MAIKTKDFLVNYDEITSGETSPVDAKGKTALKIESWYGGLGNLNEMCIEGDKLIVKLDSDKKITIKNYQSLKYLKNGNGDLFDFIEAGTVKNKNEITFNSKKLSATGTIYSDTIQASTYAYTPKGKSKKGLTIDGGKGNDSISGTDYNDVIKGGDGNDTIHGGEGNDTITGGKGVNTITYRAGDGNDVINLTKGENFTLDMLTAENEDNDISWGYANKNKDVVIYTAADEAEDKSEYITLKNFGSKDVLNNATQKTADTSSAEIRLHPENSDMDEESYTINLKDLIFKSEMGKNFTKNFTGTWLKDEIDAGSYHIYKDKAKTIIDENYNKKGLVLDGKGNNDKIYGSDYSDTLYGGDGDDEIYGGSGNNLIKGGNGNDVIYADSIFETDNNGKNVIYGDAGNDKIYGGNGNDKLYGGDGDDEIRGGKGNDTIYGDKGSDVIYGDEGNDVIYGGNDTLSINFIYGGKGNDTITGGKGNTIITYNDGDGKDVINITKGENLHINANIENTANPTFKYSENKKDLIISFGSDNETITLKNFVARKDAIAATLMKNSDGNSDIYELLENNTDKAPIIATHNIDKNFTGTWMKDLIQANETLYKKVGKTLVAKTENEKGLTLDGGAGNDSIYGSNCSDIIKGGDGDDTIYGGKGNDTLTGGKGHNTYFYKAGDGYDVINITKDEELEVSFTDTNNYDLKYGNGNKDLIISRGGDVNGSITLKNFAAKDITKSVVLTKQNENKVDLKDAIVTTLTEKSFTGSWMNDKISAMHATKNVTLRGGDGNDSIIGGQGNDKLYGDNGDDTLSGGTGNDTLTGGKGRNTYEYEKDGSIDVINVTKGEDVVIKINGTNNYHISYINGNKDLKIQDQGDPNGYFILKNFGVKDITKSAVLSRKNGPEIDLKTVTVNASGLEKSFTGSWLNDNIDARYATKNITLRGGDGNDFIFGGKGNDKIYGDNGNDTIRGSFGNDTITGGKGENHIEYSKGDGNDVINLTKGEDFYLHFDEVTDVNNAEWEFKGNDLRIWAYGKEASDQFVTIKNAKKMINNTNTAKIIINDSQQLDLKTMDYNVSSLMSQVTAWSSSSGTSGYSLTAGTDPASDIGALAAAFTPDEFNMV